MIPVGAKEPKGAAELINFLTGPKVAPIAAEAGRQFLPRDSPYCEPSTQKPIPICARLSPPWSLRLPVRRIRSG